MRGHALDRLVGIRELAVEVPHDRKQRGDQREQGPRQGQGRSIAKHGREALWLRRNPALDQFTALGQDADLTFPLVDVDANMIHGWPLLAAALTAGVLLWGHVRHHVKREASGLHPIYALRAHAEARRIATIQTHG